MDKALYDKGMAMRRKVLGDEYVDRAVANTDDFNRKRKPRKHKENATGHGRITLLR
jgi:hypothetical protein